MRTHKRYEYRQITNLGMGILVVERRPFELHLGFPAGVCESLGQVPRVLDAARRRDGRPAVLLVAGGPLVGLGAYLI